MPVAKVSTTLIPAVILTFSRERRAPGRVDHGPAGRRQGLLGLRAVSQRAAPLLLTPIRMSRMVEGCLGLRNACMKVSSRVSLDFLGGFRVQGLVKLWLW